MALLAALAAHYHWPHDFWRVTPARPRGMGWREFRAWLRELRAEPDRATAGGPVTAPGSWAGAEHDPFWLQARGARG